MKTSSSRSDNHPFNKHMLVVLLSFIIASRLYVDAAISNNEYCSITKQHTMCSPEGYGPQCGSPQGLERGIRSEDDIREILDAHNMFRSKIANGVVKRGKYGGPQPPAADMEQMEWDEELAIVAQRHADQCKFAHDCSQCRKIKRFKAVGQNLYIYKQSIKSAATNWTRGITDWYDEVDLFDKKWVKPFKFSLPIGHYSAMIWSNTNRVGCGITEYRDGKWFAKLYTCDYGPAGNFINGQMYKVGRACSSCPRGMACSQKYPGLCAPGNKNAPRTIKNATKPLNTVRSGNRKTATRRTTTTTTSTTTRTRTTTTIPTTTTTPRTTTRRPARSKTTKKRKQPTIRRVNKQRGSPATRRRNKPTRRPSRTSTKRPVLSVTTTTETNEIAPRSRFPTSSRVLFKANNITVKSLYKCDFNAPDSCGVKTAGKEWFLANGYYAVGLKSLEKTELFFDKMVPAPEAKDGGVACLTFRYKKYLPGGGKAALQVLAWPLNGRPGKVNIQKSSPRATTWIKAQVTFRKIDDFFLVLFRATAPNRKTMDLSLDDFSVTEGQCIV